jgi:hypothetical protein
MKFELIDKAKAVFDALGWIRDNDTFNSFCTLLNNLDSEEERELLIFLTSKFTRIELQNYQKHLVLALKKFQADSVHIGKGITYCPLIKKKDFNSNMKSGSLLTYPLKSNTLFNDYSISIGNRHKVVDHPSILVQKRYEFKEDELLVLIDDFIGTGTTAVSAIKFLQDNIKIELSNIVVLSLVNHRPGEDLLAAEGIRHFCSLITEKGIDFFCGASPAQKIIMQNIEARIQRLGADYKLGYLESQALVKMIRTPNNTFPVYWYRESKYYSTGGPIFER